MFNHGGKAQAFLKQIFPKEALQGISWLSIKYKPYSKIPKITTSHWRILNFLSHILNQYDKKNSGIVITL